MIVCRAIGQREPLAVPLPSVEFDMFETADVHDDVLDERAGVLRFVSKGPSYDSTGGLLRCCLCTKSWWSGW